MMVVRLKINDLDNEVSLSGMMTKERLIEFIEKHWTNIKEEDV